MKRNLRNCTNTRRFEFVRETHPMDTQPDYRLLFESLPGLYLVLDRELHIVAVSDVYLSATMTVRAAILGRHIFDVFPDNPDEPDATGVRNLRASLERVLRDARTDAMAVQKYDIRTPEGGDGAFEERYWSPSNSPVLGVDGSVQFIVHRVEDVTDYLRLVRQHAIDDSAQQALLERSARLEADIYARSQELARARERLEQRVAERTAELERSNAALRDSEVRFRALIEHGSDSITLIDRDNRILYASPSVTAVEGFTPAELVGRNGLENTHPDDLPLVQRVMGQLVDSPGIPVPVLWRRRHRDGRWLWLEGTATNLLENPAVQAIVTNYRDVTERLRTDQRVREQVQNLNLLDQITRLIAERMDLAGIFQVVVSTLERSLPVDFCCIGLHDTSANVLRISSIGAREGTVPLEEGAVIAIDDNGLGRCVGGALVYEPDVTGVPFPFPQRLGHAGLRSVVLAPLRSETSIFGVLVAARRDVDGFSSVDCEFLRQVSEHVALAASQAQLYSALQLAYEDLRNTQQAAMQEERLRALGQMASGIAHDINNALSPVALYADWLMDREPGLSERARGYLQIIQRAVGDVAETVARMREFYRHREPQVELVPVNANNLVQQVLEFTRARWSDMAQQQGVSINPVVQLDPTVPEIMGIESEIREALTNLVFNAVDAMPEGGELSLCTRRVPANEGTEGDQVAIEVHDQGTGMDEETRRRCLEPFFTTKGERGTGLGLPMVFGMVQRHSAGLEIESEPGRGSTVRLLFAVPEATVPAAPGNGGTHPVTPLRVLVIDDDPVLLNSVHNALEADGHEVAVASGGADGVALFTRAQAKGEPFAVVITDLGMPHMDGRKVAAAIKALAPGTSVILLTGWGQRMMADGDAPSSVDRILAKPPRLRELRLALAHCAARATAG